MTTFEEWEIILDLFRIESRTDLEYAHLVQRNVPKMEKYGNKRKN